jgi:stage II sporulation protein D
MVLPPMMIGPVSRGFLVAVIGVLCSLPEFSAAAQSIRVLLASDVQRLEVRADKTIWVTDADDRGHFFRSSLRIEVRGPALLLNGTRVTGDQAVVAPSERQRPGSDGPRA